MDTIISNTNIDLDDKIRNDVKPEHEDKKRLHNRIKQLDKQQQLHLFHSIIKPLNIYTITDNGTFFDLNELTSEQFWKLSYHVNLTYDCIKRDKIISELEREKSSHEVSLSTKSQNNQKLGLYNHEFDIESTSVYEPNTNVTDDLELDDLISNGAISYSKLRDAALNQCEHTRIPDESGVSSVCNSSLLTSEFESKVLNRNIYTDKRR